MGKGGFLSEIDEVGVAELSSAYRCIGLCKLLDKLCIFVFLFFPNMFSLQFIKSYLNISMFYWYFFNLPFQFKA